MEMPRIDHCSGVIFGLGHPWVGELLEAIDRGLEKGTLRVMTSKIYGEYPPDWFSGKIGERRCDIEGGEPRALLTAMEAANVSTFFMVMPRYPYIVDFDHLIKLPIVLPRCADVYFNDSLCVYQESWHYPKEQLPTHIKVVAGIATDKMKQECSIFKGSYRIF